MLTDDCVLSVIKLNFHNEVIVFVFIWTMWADTDKSSPHRHKLLSNLIYVHLCTARQHSSCYVAVSAILQCWYTFYCNRRKTTNLKKENSLIILKIYFNYFLCLHKEDLLCHSYTCHCLMMNLLLFNCGLHNPTIYSIVFSIWNNYFLFCTFFIFLKSSSC